MENRHAKATDSRYRVKGLMMHFDGNNAVIAFSHFIGKYGDRETFLFSQTLYCP